MSQDKKEILALVGISYALDNYLTNHATILQKKYEEHKEKGHSRA
jgi:hypothetical protein